MAIKPRNASEDQGPRNRYTGLTLMKPICVCPTKAQMSKMGIEVDEEPSYFSTEEKDGKQVQKVRLAFYLHKKIGEGESAENLLVQHSIFLEATLRYSNNKEKVECIDKFGKSCFITPEDYKAKNVEYDWIDKASIKAALVGQSELIGFMRNIAAYKKDDQMLLSDLAVNGDLKTLFKPDGSGLAEIRKDVLNISKIGNSIRVLLGVKMTDDGKIYQELFPYAIGRSFAKTKYFHNQLVKLSKSSSNYLENRDFGPIDLSSENPKEDDYRLSPYEEVKADASNRDSNSAIEGANGYPTEWDTNTSTEDPFGVPVLAGESDDDFSDPFA